jgi:DNA-binding SARP family transcriptional activator
MDIERPDSITLNLLGQTLATCQSGGEQRSLHIQPKPLHLLAYLALDWKRSYRREELQALFWPDKSARSAPIICARRSHRRPCTC